MPPPPLLLLLLLRLSAVQSYRMPSGRRIHANSILRLSFFSPLGTGSVRRPASVRVAAPFLSGDVFRPETDRIRLAVSHSDRKVRRLQLIDGTHWSKRRGNGATVLRAHRRRPSGRSRSVGPYRTTVATPVVNRSAIPPKSALIRKLPERRATSHV